MSAAFGTPEPAESGGHLDVDSVDTFGDDTSAIFLALSLSLARTTTISLFPCAKTRSRSAGRLADQARRASAQLFLRLARLWHGNHHQAAIDDECVFWKCE
jgi:hypothetical protein